MSATTGSEGGTSEAAAAGSGASGAVTAGASGAPPAAGAPVASAPAGRPEPKNVSSAAQAAATRVKARQGVAGAAAASKNPPAAGQAAAVSEPKPAPTAGAGAGGGGTQAADDAKPKAEGATGAAEAGSTAIIPADWPQADRERLAKLPAEAQTLVVEQYKTMQAGLTRANQALAREREQLGVLGSKMQQYKVGSEQVSDLVDTAAAFEADPRGVLERLAKEKGIAIHFGDAPAAATGEVPEFKTTAEMADWVSKKVAADLAQQQQRTQSDQEQKRQRAERLDSLKRQFGAAHRELPDFGTHENAVIEQLRAMGPSADVQSAYRIVTYDAMAARVKEGEKAKADLAALRTEVENERKKRTQPPQVERGEQRTKEDASLSPAQRAMARAERRRSASASASN